MLVVGMHRSGTSAVTGVLGGLGLQMPRAEDRIKPTSSNPEHWESHSLMELNETLLAQSGGTWDAPPGSDLGTPTPWVGDGVADPGSALARAFPAPGPVAWKDPRLSLLLPAWRQVLPGPLAVILVWRHPLAVARSLRERDQMSLARGLALWEHYNLAALDGVRGLDTYVINYDELMGDRDATVGALGGWLRSLDQFASTVAEDGASALVVDTLRHQRPDADDRVLLDEHRQLIERLHSLTGPHRAIDPGPSTPDSAWTSEVLASRLELHEVARDRQRLGELVVEVEGFANEYRESADTYRLQAETYRQRLEADRDELAHQRELLAKAGRETQRAERIAANMRASTSWRMTRPLRLVVGKLAVHSSRARRGAR